ncbi:MAG: hypothetical protein NWE94_07020 [Candidatus Bathyarchaeota archaeon]|nr:hypothetical protein [Candidatus Bathyarchaeota archaeon]
MAKQKCKEGIFRRSIKQVINCESRRQAFQETQVAGNSFHLQKLRIRKISWGWELNSYPLATSPILLLLSTFLSFFQVHLFLSALI